MADSVNRGTMQQRIKQNGNKQQAGQMAQLGKHLAERLRGRLQQPGTLYGTARVGKRNRNTIDLFGSLNAATFIWSILPDHRINSSTGA